jgi:hypothetical protein
MILRRVIAKGMNEMNEVTMDGVRVESDPKAQSPAGEHP